MIPGIKEDFEPFEDSEKFRKTVCSTFFENLAHVEMMMVSYMSTSICVMPDGTKMPQYKGFFGLRSLIGYNSTLDYQIKRLFLANEFPTFELVKLYTMDEIKTTLRSSFECKEQHYALFSHSYYEKMFCDFMDACMVLPDIGAKGHFFESFSPSTVLDHHYGNLFVSSSRDIAVFLIDLYMRKKEMLLYAGNIYSKSADSEWIFYKELEKFGEDCFDVILFLRQQFPVQLGAVDLQKIFMDSLPDVISAVKQIPTLLPTGVVWNGVVESDGRPHFSALERWEVSEQYWQLDNNPKVSISKNYFIHNTTS